jgi:transposase-like protein
MTKRRNFSDKFKAAVALEALSGDKTVQEIAVKRQIHPTQVSTVRRQGFWHQWQLKLRERVRLIWLV